MSHNKARAWLIHLGALEGAVAATTLFLIPSEGGTLSPARLVLIAISLAMSALWMHAGTRHSGRLDRLARPGMISALALLSFLFGLILFLLRYLDPPHLLSAYERLSPLLWYSFALSIQTSFYLLYLYGGFHLQNLSMRKPVYIHALKAFGILLLVFVFVAVTRLGVTFDSAYWGEPGVPILGWQFGLALTGGLLALAIGLHTQTHLLDLLLPAGLYLLMLVICLSVPVDVLRRSFYMPIVRPESQPFPYSDSAYYDQMAQSVLIGHPYQGEIPTRPLYILLLTFLHLLFGQQYELIIAAQTAVLAFLPVLLYSLGKKLHSRTAGVTIALFFIFREWTSLLISSETRVTNTKILLVDLPTLLLLLFVCLLVYRWLERRGWHDAFSAGGVFGILLLLRTQSMVILPFILVAAVLVLGWQNRSFYRNTALFLFGLGLAISPWLLHNQRLTGEFAFDAAFQNRLIASMYVYQGNSAIQNLAVEDMGLAQLLIESVLRDPGHVFGFIGNHFLATQVNSLLVLPLIEPYNGIHAPINLYWMEWDGRLEWYNALLLIVYLAVISLGIGVVWKRWRWLGLLPLGFSIGYALSTAMGRFSSWRYDYPADWIAYFYFGVGFAELLHQGAALFGAGRDVAFPSGSQVGNPPKPSPPAKGVFLALLFVFIGAAPWMIRNISSPRYADQSPETLETRLLSMTDAPPAGMISDFHSQPEVFLQEGRLLYPRFFGRNGGLSSANPSPAYRLREYPRMGFMLLNQNLSPAVFPIRNIPKPFPHGVDVIVLGCQREDYVEARLLAFPELDVIHRGAPLSEPCMP